MKSKKISDAAGCSSATLAPSPPPTHEVGTWKKEGRGDTSKAGSKMLRLRVRWSSGDCSSSVASEKVASSE